MNNKPLLTVKEAVFWAHVLERTARKYDLKKGSDRVISWGKVKQCPLCRVSNRMEGCFSCIYYRLFGLSCNLLGPTFSGYKEVDRAIKDKDSMAKNRARWIRKVVIPKVLDSCIDPDVLKKFPEYAISIFNRGR